MRVPALPLSIVVALGLLSVGCATAEIGDMDSVFEGPPMFVNVTARSARVVATTNIDMACAVAYGTTEEYGHLATDTDMAGGGHQEHGPLLTGLEPDTEYHVTFGGTGPDGTVYRYRDLTFRTLKEEPGATARPPGENLALLSAGARVVGTSSNFGGGDDTGAWGGNRAFDGDATTEWSSDGDGDDAWIEIELPAETRVTGLGFWTRTMGTSAQAGSFRVVSDKGDVGGPFELEDAASVHYFEADLTATRLRFEVVESSGGNVGAVEIEVFGSPDP